MGKQAAGNGVYAPSLARYIGCVTNGRQKSPGFNPVKVEFCQEGKSTVWG